MHRIRRRRRRVNGKLAASAVAAGLLLAASHSHALPMSGAAASAAPSPAAATAVAYARAELGKPYVYGATGPDAFDCSGLVQAAWAAAGVSIPRTSEQQWADLPHVSSPQPGDLVFYTGSEPVKLNETSGGWIYPTGLLGLDGGAGLVDPHLGWQGRG